MIDDFQNKGQLKELYAIQEGGEATYHSVGWFCSPFRAEAPSEGTVEVWLPLEWLAGRWSEAGLLEVDRKDWELGRGLFPIVEHKSG